MISKNQIFVVVDIEADGPAVGLHSILSLAAVATTDQEEVSRFYRKIQPLEDARRDPTTMAWWDKHPVAWEEVNTDMQLADKVLTEFYEWVVGFEREPIFVSCPVGFDYTFVSWYLFRFAPGNPFMNKENSMITLDLCSYIAGKFNLDYDKSSRLKWPSWLISEMSVHTHTAIDDAVGYAFVLRKIINSKDKNW